MTRKTSYNSLVNSNVVSKEIIVNQLNQRRSLRGKGGLKLFLGVSFLLISLFFFNNKSFSQGYTTPADANSNGIYDFQEAGSSPVISAHPTDSTICEDISADFNVVAAGDALSYQWMVSTDGGTTFNNITAAGTDPAYSGYGTSTLTLSGSKTFNNGYQYQVVVHSETFACDSTISNIANLTVNAIPAAPAATTPQDFCSDESHLVSDLTTGATTPNWYTASTGGPALPVGTTLANGNYYVSETTAGCESARTLVSVTVNPTPGAPAATSPQDFCSDESHLVSDLTSGATTPNWYSASTGGSALPVGTTLVTGDYYVSETTAGCEGPRTLVSVTVNPTPGAPAATSPQDFCSADSPLVSDLTTGAITPNWYTASTGGSALLVGTTLATGNYYVSETTAGCESARTLVSVTINPTPGAPAATSPQEFCTADSPLVSDLTSGATTPNWYSASTGGSALPVGTTLANGNYYVSETTAGCEGPRTLVSVTINPTPAAPAATSPQDFCSADSPLVSDLTSGATTPNWYKVPNGGSVLTMGTVLTTGDYYVSETTLGCEGPRTLVSVTVNVTPATPSAPSPQNFCTLESHLVSDLTTGASAPTWYTVSTGGTALLTTDSLVTGTYYVSETSNGCESARRTVSVVVNNSPSAPSASTNEFCSANNPTVSDLTPNGPNYSWYEFATGGLPLGSSTLLDSAFYYVTQTIAGCESERTAVFVQINITPGVPASGNQDFCSGDNPQVADLTVTGNSPQWYENSTGGVPLLNTDPLSTESYFVTQTIDGCESPRLYIAVTVNTTPSVPVAPSPQSFCTGSMSTISDIIAFGTDLKWYDAITGGTLLDTTDVLVTGSYFVSQTENGCESNRLQINVSIEDTEAPVVTCSPYTLNLDNTGNATLTTANVLNTVTDNCAIPTLSLSQEIFTCADVGTVSVTLSAEDADSNVGTCNADVLIVDNTNPVALCQSFDLYLDVNGNGTVLASSIDNGSTDACGPLGFSLSKSDYDCADVGPHNVTLTVTDGSSNSDNCNTSIIVIDTINPIAICIDTTIALDASENASILATELNNGSTDACGIASFVASQTTFNSSHLGFNNDTLTVTDNNGNVNTCISIVEVIDGTPPVAVCQNDTIYLDNAGSAILNAADIDGGSIDNDGIATLTLSQTDFTCANLGDNSVNLVVEDNAGNTDSCPAIVTVLDTIRPEVTCIDATVYLDINGLATVVYSDFVTSLSDNCGSPAYSISGIAYNCASVGMSNMATITANDASGNIAACSASITILDAISPAPACLDITIPLDGSGNASIVAADIDGGSSDACGIASLSANVTTFTTADLGNNNVILTVTDINGNDSTCTAVVTVSDTNPPTAVCNDTTLYLDGMGQATVLAEELDGGSTDNGVIVSYTATQVNFDCSDIGTNNVTLTVEDDGGNTNNCNSVVTVLDSISPTVVCQDVSIELDASGNTLIDPALLVISSSDNCNVVDSVLSQSSFTCSDIGINTVIVSVADSVGNVGSCSSNVTIENFAWSPVCQDITVNLDLNGEATIIASEIDGGTNVTCGSITVSASQTFFTNIDIGTNNVTLYVTDDFGRVDSCVAVVNVTDTSFPNAQCQDLTVYVDSVGIVSITPEQVNDNSTDNGSITGLSLDIDTFDCSMIGDNTVVLAVEDDASNISYCNAIITVLDTIAPEVECNSVTLYLDSIGNGTLTSSVVVLSSSDNCSIESFGLSQDIFSCVHLGDNTVTLSVADSSGNIGSCDALVVVVDAISPVVICEDITIPLDATSNASIIVDQVDGTGATDNCTVSSVVLDVYDFTIADLGANDVLVTATDNSGNVSSCIAVVNITDGNAPLPVCISDTTLYLDGAGMASITAEELDSASTDNGTIDYWSASQTNFDCSDMPGVTVVLTMEDNSGNTSSCDVIVNVVDSLPPIVTCLDTVIYLDYAGFAYLTLDQVSTAIDDNCSVVDTTLFQDTFTGDELGSNFAPVTVTDGSGNSTTCDAIVTILDTIAPNLICNDLIVPLDINGQATVTSNQVGAGSTDNDDILFITNVMDFDCTQIGDTLYVLDAFDISGNTASCTATLTIVDNMAPNVLCQDFTLDLDEFNQGTLTIANIDNGTSDNCCMDSLSLSQYDFDENDIGVNVVTLTAVDCYGNTSTCIANVQVNSTLPPEAVCQDITVSLDENGEVSIIAEDVDGGSSDANGQVSLTLNQYEFTCTDIGANTVTMTVTNLLSESSTCEATVTVIDDMVPVINCPSDTTINNDFGSCGAIFDYGTLVANDNCSATIAIDFGQATNTFFDLGSHAIQYTATDLSGNESQCSFTVVVIDNELPQITCPDNVYVSDPLVFFDAPIFNDNCSADLTQIDGLISGSEFPHGITTTTFMVTDVTGFTAECSFNIIVNNDVVAVNDSVNSFENSGGILIDPLVNDYDPDGDVISIVSASSNNGVTMIQGTNLTYIPPSDWCGLDTIVYTISDGYGPNATALIFVDVSCDLSLFIPEGFSPNNDGINDYFEIVGLDVYPESILNIYNRWSHLVFEAKEYDNSWDGTTINPLTFGKKQLPQGTYFYSLKLDDDHEIIKGYLYISTK